MSAVGLAVTGSTGSGVRMTGIRRQFENGTVALDDFSLEVEPGEFLAILGPSGCGKSSLLRLIAGLDRPQAGEVQINGSSAGKLAGIAYVFQDAHLLPWRTVLQNVALPLELMHSDRRTREAEARRAIEMVGLSDAAARSPSQLSGGMRMRVSLARAMVTRPRLLLLDEPFAALDEITRQRLDEELLKLWRSGGMTVIFVTHSTGEATFLARRAIVLSRRPGRIIEDRPIDLPINRTGSIRGTPQFALQTRGLYEALERGSS